MEQIAARVSEFLGGEFFHGVRKVAVLAVGRDFHSERGELVGQLPHQAVRTTALGKLRTGVSHQANKQTTHVHSNTLAAGQVRLSGMSATPGLRAQEPDNPHGGLSVTEFSSPGIWTAVRQAIHLLPRNKRRLLFLGAAVQVSLGLLDLIGIALIGLVAAIVVSGLGVASLPSSIQNVLDTLGLGDLSVSQLSVTVALAAVVILVAKTLLSALMTRRIARFLANRQAEASARLAREFLSRPLAQVQRWTTPEATYALGAGVAAATVALLGAAIIIAAEVFLFSIVGISLLIYDPILTVTAGIFFGLIGLFLHRVLGRWTERNAEVMKDTSIDTLTAVSEALATYRETTVLNRREFYVDRFESLIGRSAVANANSGFILEVPKYVLESALYVGILVLATVQFLTQSWATAAATVALFLAAGSRIIPALLRLQGAGITIRNAAVQAQPAFFMAQFLEDSRSSGDHFTSERARVQELISSRYPDFDASVTVTQAWLSYPGAEAPALQGIDLHVPQGSSVALVGPTGAGKSSLADLVLGVHEPDSGSVDIGGLSPSGCHQHVAGCYRLRSAGGGAGRWIGASQCCPGSSRCIDR